MRRKTVSFYMDEELRKYMTPTAKKYLLCSWYRYMFDFIPFRSGIMASLMDFPKDETVRNEVKISPEAALQMALATIKSDPKNVIRFKAPYALRQYHGESFNFTHDLHPNACAKWAEVAADLYGEKIIKEYANFVERTMRSFAYICNRDALWQYRKVFLWFLFFFVKVLYSLLCTEYLRIFQDIHPKYVV